MDQDEDLTEHDQIGSDDDYTMLSDEELLEGLDPYIRDTLSRWMSEADEQKRNGDRARRARRLATPLVPRRTRPLPPGEERGTSRTLAVRVPRWVEEQTRRRFQEIGVTPSQGMRQILEEWCVEQLFPALEHRDDRFVRLAAVRGGPRVNRLDRRGQAGNARPRCA